MGLKGELKSDLNKAFKGYSLKESEPCPVGACLVTSLCGPKEDTMTNLSNNISNGPHLGSCL